MKKALLFLVVIAATLCLNGCAQSCHCTVTVDSDPTFHEEWDVVLDAGERCSDYENNSGGRKTSCSSVF